MFIDSVNWTDICEACEEELERRKDAIISYVRSDIEKVPIACGEYDGFRQAIEFIESMVINNKETI